MREKYLVRWWSKDDGWKYTICKNRIGADAWYAAQKKLYTKVQMWRLVEECEVSNA